MKKNFSPILSIFLVVLVDVFGLALVMPLLPFYAEKLGASPAVVGMMVSIYALAQLIAGPFLGRLSDRIGRRPVLLISQAGTLAGFILLACSQSLWLVFLSRALDGLTAGNITVAQAYITDHTEGKERTRAFGIIGAAFGLGFLVGPAIAGLLAHYDMVYPIYLACVLSAISIVTTYVLLPKTERPQPSELRESIWESARAAARDPSLALLLFLFFCFSYLFSTEVSGIGLFMERRLSWEGNAFGARETGLVFAYLGLIGILVQGFAMKYLVHSWGERKMTLIGFATMLLGFAMLARTFSLPMLAGALALLGFGGCILRPSLQSLISQRARPEQRGMLLGFSQSLQSVAQILAPLAGGYLIGANWLGAWALTGAVLAGIALLISYGKTSTAVAMALLLSASASATETSYSHLNFIVLKPDGTEVTRYNSFLKTEELEKNILLTTTFMDSKDPRDMLLPNLTNKIIKIPGSKTFIFSGISEGIPFEGTTQFIPEGDGRARMILKQDRANWWSLRGDGYREKDGRTNAKMEVRNKSGELVYIYVQESRPASAAEIRTIKKAIRLGQRATNSKEKLKLERKRLNFSYPEPAAPVPRP